ncbi:winged helix-turn-helix domain-containing protein [Xylanimonas ulmi]|uniref:Transcriptional regulator n=1 Tax=Xylanimonas ulmi TaxID=228973 RepID=A0A4Q7M3T7_9MICO|nr:winged helix-turn-helix domain-containing protein [Xylanibacterium ulmi]RZS62596.1 transcriptional regulator [Xylanibacterium ulmi]
MPTGDPQEEVGTQSTFGGRWMSALTQGPAVSEPGYVLCVGLSLAQIREVTMALAGRAAVLAVADTDAARALLGPPDAGPPVESVPPVPPVTSTEFGPDLGAMPRPQATTITLTPAHLLAGPPRHAVTTATRSTPASGTAYRGTSQTLAAGAAQADAVTAPVTGGVPLVTLHRGPLSVDLATREVTARGMRVHLSRREFDLLAALASDVGRVWSFEELTLLVWRQGYLGDADHVTSAVKRLRKRLGPVPGLEVASVRGVGYRLVVPA